jgi:hypothetical protein
MTSSAPTRRSLFAAAPLLLRAQPGRRPPNFLFLLTDDQR